MHFNFINLTFTFTLFSISLDGIDKIFLWIGSNYADASKADLVAKRFLHEDKSGRKFQANQVIKVKQGSEDSAFKSFFPKWN